MERCNCNEVIQVAAISSSSQNDLFELAVYDSNPLVETKTKVIRYSANQYSPYI